MISSILTTLIVPAIMGVLAWFATNWVGRPILDTRQARIKALQAAEQNAYVGGAASAERVTEARAALRDAAAALRAISRGHSWQVRLYCRRFHYDLEEVASTLIRLHNTDDRIRRETITAR
jgi:hypothetical protein